MEPADEETERCVSKASESKEKTYEKKTIAKRNSQSSRQTF